MQVEMRTRIGGFRNGLEWPDVGGVIDVPEDEARSLIAARYANPCRGEDDDAEPDAEPAEPTGDPNSGDGGPTPAEPTGAGEPVAAVEPASVPVAAEPVPGVPASEPVSELTRQQKAALTRAANKAAAEAS